MALAHETNPYIIALEGKGCESLGQGGVREESVAMLQKFVVSYTSLSSATMLPPYKTIQPNLLDHREWHIMIQLFLLAIEDINVFL